MSAVDPNWSLDKKVRPLSRLGKNSCWREAVHYFLSIEKSLKPSKWFAGE
jgi:hypothetical protein